MRATLRFALALLVAFVVMLSFRALAFTIYTIDGTGLEPEFKAGDRVMVNRWSYGLRAGGANIFPYGRICRQPVRKGDIVAFENPLDSMGRSIVFGRCTATPGDTVSIAGHTTLIVPGLATCADRDYYWIRSLNPKNPLDSRHFGFVAENLIIGRAFLVVYNKDDARPMWAGWDADRWMLLR